MGIPQETVPAQVSPTATVSAEAGLLSAQTVQEPAPPPETEGDVCVPTTGSGRN
jgi:hypothetical protein